MHHTSSQQQASTTVSWIIDMGCVHKVSGKFLKVIQYSIIAESRILYVGVLHLPLFGIVSTLLLKEFIEAHTK